MYILTFAYFYQAEAITLTVAQAFNIAYEKWQVHKKKKEEKRELKKQHKSDRNSEEESIQLGNSVKILG